MKNQGLNTHRLQGNPLEVKYQKEWDIINPEDSLGILDYLLANEINKPCGEVVERDIQVAATVIQWLGSPVGQDFIAKVNS